MIFDILEKKIEDAGLAVAGDNLFRSFMPAEISVGVMTRIPLEGIPVDTDFPCRHKGRIQVIVRHTDPVDGNKLANDVVKALRVDSSEEYAGNSERGDARIDLFIPETLPIQFPRLEGDGIEWSIHFKTVFAFDEV